MTKKGTFSPLKNLGGGLVSQVPPPVPTPLLAAVKNIENDSQGGQE